MADEGHIRWSNVTKLTIQHAQRQDVDKTRWCISLTAGICVTWCDFQMQIQHHCKSHHCSTVSCKYHNKRNQLIFASSVSSHSNLPKFKTRKEPKLLIHSSVCLIFLPAFRTEIGMAYLVANCVNIWLIKMSQLCICYLIHWGRIHKHNKSKSFRSSGCRICLDCSIRDRSKLFKVVTKIIYRKSTMFIRGITSSMHLHNIIGYAALVFWLTGANELL